MDIDYQTVYQAGPTEVLDLLTDPDFLRDYATELGVSSYTADVSRSGDTRSVTLHLVAPTDQIAGIFKPLVGPEITITDTRSWEPDGDGGYQGHLRVEANANGHAATITGSLSLTPDGAASRFAVQADVKVKIRFIGGLAKGAIAELGIDTMKDQTKVMNRWLEQMIDPALSST